MRLNGVVKFFNQSRGFGFISPENGEKDVFVHASALERSGLSSTRVTKSPSKLRTTNEAKANRLPTWSGHKPRVR